jgi:ATP-dependent RNA helicase DeaD
MQGIIEQYQQEHDVPSLEIAAALSKMSLGDKPLLMKDRKERPARSHERSNERSRGHDRGDPKSRKARGEPRGAKDLPPLQKGMERFLLEVGYAHGVKPGNIVGAIANEAGVDGQNIGHIEISDEFSIVDLPEGMPKEIFTDLKKVRVCGQALKIVRLDSGKPDRGRRSESTDRSERKHDDKKGAPARRAPEKRSAGKSSGKKSGKNKSGAKGSGGKKTAVKKAAPKKKVRKRDQLNKGAPKPRAMKRFAKNKSSSD